MANLNNDVSRFFICCAVIILTGNIAVAFGNFEVKLYFLYNINLSYL
jgi:hypothetical protein